MDAFAVSVCGGLKMEGRERFKGGLIFGAWFGVFQAVMPLVGYELGSHFAKVADTYSHWIIFAILAYIGWNMIQEAGEDQEKEKSPGSGPCWAGGGTSWMPWGWAWALLPGYPDPAGGAGNRHHHFLPVLLGCACGSLIGMWARHGRNRPGALVLLLIGLKAVIEHYGILDNWTPFLF